MSREIKFRAFNTSTESWQFGVLDFEYYMPVEENLNLEEFWLRYRKGCYDKKTLGQFTGIKLPGKEIWADDIIYCSGCGNGLVFQDFWGGWSMRFKDQEVRIHDLVMEGDLGEMKGNIHENPELLE